MGSNGDFSWKEYFVLPTPQNGQTHSNNSSAQQFLFLKNLTSRWIWTTRFSTNIFLSTDIMVENPVNAGNWKSTHHILQVSNNHRFCDSDSLQQYFCDGFLLGHQIYSFQFEQHIWQDFGVNSSWLVLKRVASAFCTSHVLVTSVNYGSSNNNALQTFDLAKQWLKQKRIRRDKYISNAFLLS